MAIFKKIGKRLSKAYYKEPKMTHEEWATKKVYFPSQDISPILGYFKIKFSPQYKLLFKLMDRPDVHTLFAKWAPIPKPKKIEKSIESIEKITNLF